MIQKGTRSANGVVTRFVPSQLLDIAALIDDQLTIVLNSLQPGQPQYNLPFLVYENRISPNRITKVPLAVMMSDAVINAALLANPAIVPLIRYHLVVEPYLLPNDRFYRTLAQLAPTQEMITEIFEIGLTGVVTPPNQFVDATLSVREFVPPPAPMGSTIVPTAISGTTPSVTFGAADIGKEVEIEYVTVLEYPVIEIRRQAEQPSDITNIYQGTDAYMMHPSLAALLGIVLPSL